MAKTTVGSRVMAIRNTDEDNAYVFGCGVYDGEVVPPEGSYGMLGTLAEMGVPNPKITLDSGKVVWGCECWWGSEEKAKMSLGNLNVVEVDIDEYREECKKAEAEENGEWN